ncbi:BZ3500_MvSof-1268-A1-R1_Chr11-2g03418 [Microbotryum saponariae]|uniref:BZ3500_MvSof-1268-A1-R1_Chr11-2g03418 protein n=1 Tax=Microbotryum saponariae TaxID=289078 RepID=A0A2X0KND8_9BASI|nr:BZ3500_MvSof-1268-A1-R1_Chr11-2g03418 [Microbotryum saponariae]SDA03334.1 BZ3501_MvSof-1269-A2-R1_Chr11g02989 [Microbotryum saponariae]
MVSASKVCIGVGLVHQCGRTNSKSGSPIKKTGTPGQGKSSNQHPSHFPTIVQYLTAPLPSRHLPAAHPLIDATHPAKGQFGLFANAKIPPRTWIRDYLGVVHPEQDVDSTSDYDLCLARIPIFEDPSSETIAFSPVRYETIGIDATKAGNEARFINDYRGVLKRPNAVFESREWKSADGTTVQGVRMSVWSGPKGVEKGSEICVSYGKGFWDGRKSEPT